MVTVFQSTLPVWGATRGLSGGQGDSWYFNPRSPCGERRQPDAPCPIPGQFQSTLPVWGATGLKSFVGQDVTISIHAPRVGSDSAHSIQSKADQRFQSTLPVWGATSAGIHRQCRFVHFNPRSPCGERQQRYTNFAAYLWQRGRIFAFLWEERRDSHQAAALRDRFFDGNLGANLPAFSVYYGFAVRESRCPPANSCSCSQNAPPSFHTGCPDSKTAASPFLRP